MILRLNNKVPSALPHLVAYSLHTAGSNSYLGMISGIAATREEKCKVGLTVVL